APGSAYRQTNLLSDIPGLAPVLDPLLVNPWGISMTGSSPFWVANNGTSTSQLIRGDVSGAPVVLNAAPQTITIAGSPGLPTGTVANTTGSATDFTLPGACASPPCRAIFLFASLTGNITGWNPNAPAAGSTTAVNAVAQPSRVYTGLAIGSNSGGNRLYAAVFKNRNIDVYDPTLALTTPFGAFGGAVLVGNSAPISNSSVGSNPPINSINAFALLDGASKGALVDESGETIAIDGLWALQFGNGGARGDVNTLYFTAGPAS